MKRSRINAAIDVARAAFAEYGLRLPPWAQWGPEHWAAAGPAHRAIRINDLGWTVTDFSTGNFDNVGTVMFTVRNGHRAFPEQGTPYAEKLFFLLPGQRIPMHLHFAKTEDIIHRSGGVLMMRVHQATPERAIDPGSKVTVTCDGVERTFEAGEAFEIPPGSSATIRSGVYHTFWAKDGAGVLIGGEVSTVSDAQHDNRFAEPVQRYMEIEEDEPPRYLLSHEYPKF